MEVTKISLDMRDSTKISRLFQVIFGLICLAVSAWYLLNIAKADNFSGTNLIAIAFLFLFGIWELLTAAGITDRYIIISDEKIVLKNKYVFGPEIHKADNLVAVIFKPVSFELHHKDGSRTVVKLGIYYRERSAEIMEAVESFCTANSITTEGLEEENK